MAASRAIIRVYLCDASFKSLPLSSTSTLKEMHELCYAKFKTTLKDIKEPHLYHVYEYHDDAKEVDLSLIPEDRIPLKLMESWPKSGDHKFVFKTEQEVLQLGGFKTPTKKRAVASPKLSALKCTVDPAADRKRSVQEKRIQRVMSWVNSKLGARRISVTNIKTDFSSGVVFIFLVEELSSAPLGGCHHLFPADNNQMIENIKCVIDYLSKNGCSNATTCTIKDIQSGNAMTILKLLGLIAMHFRTTTPLNTVQRADLSALELQLALVAPPPPLPPPGQHTQPTATTPAQAHTTTNTPTRHQWVSVRPTPTPSSEFSPSPSDYTATTTATTSTNTTTPSTPELSAYSNPNQSNNGTASTYTPSDDSPYSVPTNTSQPPFLDLAYSEFDYSQIVYNDH
ncbi:hypothetical protein Pelo_3921 [Pelomyxa schiedti]|nr:hypothetical protein Pelo_3921 [Pelomyxa schiedti]